MCVFKSKHKNVQASVWRYLFVEFLQLCLNTSLIPLLDALDNPLQVYVHTYVHTEGQG